MNLIIPSMVAIRMFSSEGINFSSDQDSTICNLLSNLCPQWVTERGPAETRLTGRDDVGVLQQGEDPQEREVWQVAYGGHSHNTEAHNIVIES